MRTTGKATDLITFSRSSGGTYLDSDGVLKTASADIPRIEYDANGNVLGLLVEESRTNLVTTADFSSVTWAKANSLVTSGYAGVDGTNGAYLIEPNGSPSYFDVKISSIVAPAASVYTWSCYFKTISADSFQLRVRDPSNITNRTDAGFAGLLVGNPVVSVNSFGDYSGGTASVTEIGSGWWRATVSTTTGATANVRVEVLRTGSPTGQMLIQNPQLEAGAFPTSYIPTSGSTATRAADVASIATSEFGYRDDEGTLVVEYDRLYTGSNGMYIATISDGATNNKLRFYGIGLGIDGVYGSRDGVQGTISLATGAMTLAPKKIAGAFAKDNAAAIDSVGGAVGVDTSFDMPLNVSVVSIGSSDGNFQLNGHIKSIKYIPRRLTNDQLQEITS